jgi:hypothetical protein
VSEQEYCTVEIKVTYSGGATKVLRCSRAQNVELNHIPTVPTVISDPEYYVQLAFIALPDHDGVAFTVEQYP